MLNHSFLSSKHSALLLAIFFSLAYFFSLIHLQDTPIISSLLVSALLLALYLSFRDEFVHVLFNEKYFICYAYTLVMIVEYCLGRTLPNKVLMSFVLTSIPLVFLVLAKARQVSGIQHVLKWLLRYVLTVCVFTLFMLSIDPDISRRLAQSGYYTNLNILECVLTAGFEQVYSLVFIVGTLVFLLRKGTSSILQWLLIIIGTVTIVAAAYTYAILFFAMAVCVSLVIPFIAKLTRTQVVILFVVTAAALFFLTPLILDFLALLFADNDRVGARIAGIKSLVTGGETAVTDIRNRIFVYQVSIETWLDKDNFWFGVGYSGYLDYGERGIGGHSDVFDTFAYYGLIGGLAFLFSLIMMGHIIVKRFKGSDRLWLIACFTIYFLMLVANPCHTIGLLSACYAITPMMVYSAPT